MEEKTYLWKAVHGDNPEDSAGWSGLGAL
jgi:hypothetical protein